MDSVLNQGGVVTLRSILPFIFPISLIAGTIMGYALIGDPKIFGNLAGISGWKDILLANSGTSTLWGLFSVLTMVLGMVAHSGGRRGKDKVERIISNSTEKMAPPANQSIHDNNGIVLYDITGALIKSLQTLRQLFKGWITRLHVRLRRTYRESTQPVMVPPSARIPDGQLVFEPPTQTDQQPEANQTSVSAPTTTPPAVKILFETDHYKIAQYKKELLKEIQNADIIVVEFPGDFNKELDELFYILSYKYHLNFQLNVELKVLFNLLHGSGKKIYGGELLIYTVRSPGPEERQLNQSLQRGDFFQALRHFVEAMISVIAIPNIPRDENLTRLLQTLYLDYPDKKFLVIRGVSHTFLYHHLKRQGIPIEATFLGRKRRQPVIFGYNDALHRTLTHHFKRKQQSLIVDPVLAARALLITMWLNYMHVQGIRDQANFKLMNRVVRKLSLSDIERQILSVTGGGRSLGEMIEGLIQKQGNPNITKDNGTEKEIAESPTETKLPKSEYSPGKTPNINGGMMLWVKDKLYPALSLEEYARRKASLVENSGALVLGGILIGLPLYLIFGNLNFALRWGYISAWAFFMLGHAHFIASMFGSRAPPRKHALLISLINVALVFLPLPDPYSIIAAIPLSFLSHYFVNRALIELEEKALRQKLVNLWKTKWLPGIRRFAKELALYLSRTPPLLILIISASAITLGLPVLSWAGQEGGVGWQVWDTLIFSPVGEIMGAFTGSAIMMFGIISHMTKKKSKVLAEKIREADRKVVENDGQGQGAQVAENLRREILQEIKKEMLRKKIEEAFPEFKADLISEFDPNVWRQIEKVGNDKLKNLASAYGWLEYLNQFSALAPHPKPSPLTPTLSPKGRGEDETGKGITAFNLDKKALSRLLPYLTHEQLIWAMNSIDELNKQERNWIPAKRHAGMTTKQSNILNIGKTLFSMQGAFNVATRLNGSSDNKGKRNWIPAKLHAGMTNYMNFKKTLSAFRGLGAVIAPDTRLSSKDTRALKKAMESGEKFINKLAKAKISYAGNIAGNATDFRIYGFDVSRLDENSFTLDMMAEFIKSGKINGAIALVTAQPGIDIKIIKNFIKDELASRGIKDDKVVEEMLAKTHFGKIIVTGRDLAGSDLDVPLFNIDSTYLYERIRAKARKAGLSNDNNLPVELFTETPLNFDLSWRKDIGLRIMAILSPVHAVEVERQAEGALERIRQALKQA